mgnify:CR=1 FL=1
MRFLWLAVFSVALAQGVPKTASPYLKGLGYVEALLFPNYGPYLELPAVYCVDVLRLIHEGKLALEEALDRVERLHRARFPSGAHLASPMGLALEACLKLGGSLDRVLWGRDWPALKELMLGMVPSFVVPARVGRLEEIRSWKARIVLQDGQGKELASLPHLNFVPLLRSEGRSYVGHVVYRFWEPMTRVAGGWELQGPGTWREGEIFLRAVGKAHQVAFVVDRGGKRETYVISPKRFPDLW